MDDNTAITSPPPVCQLSPEQIAGPYFRNPKLIRRNISEGMDGIPLVLRLTIVDAMTGQPVTGAVVDIWHCNARGAYSGWSKVDPDKEVDVDAIGSIPRTDDDTYLRGGQFTDQQGVVRFTTIYPGFFMPAAPCIFMWRYESRPATTIWKSGMSPGSASCIFPEVASRTVLNAREYRGRGTCALNNEQDEFYQGMGGEASTLNVHAIGRDSNEDGFFSGT